MSTKFFVLLFFTVVCLLAQPQAALRHPFESKTVRVKIDIPATNDGVDLQYRGDPPLDFRSYSQRVKRYGVENIKFHLGGGGYGTFGDDTGNVSPGTASKSRRESNLERDLRNETDPRRTSSGGRPRNPDAVYRILGEPSNKDRSSFGAFEQITATWVRSGNLTRVAVINEVAVKITVESR